ncbi:MAG: elongation factor P [Spirochaetaceae bacterium]|nr:MAG: elongation factor P [Spirochaetaceae bacterium]
MIRAGEISKGVFLLIKNEPYEVVEREFVNPGKGSAFVRLKMKNLRSGQVLKQVNKTHETLEEIQVEDKPYQYLYADDNSYHFMDTATYEQIEVGKVGHEEKQQYLKEGNEYQLVLWDADPIEIEIPYKMVFAVTEAQNAIKGDTVTGGTKPVTLETGLVVRVPLFIKQGDRVLVNTETNEYVERVNS